MSTGEITPIMSPSTLPVLPRISDYVAHWAGQRPTQEALVDERIRLTYHELQREVDRLARALLSRGIRHGDRVGMIGPPSVQGFVHFLASSSIGATWVGLNPKYTAAELSQVVQDSRPAMLFALLEVDDVVAGTLSQVVSAATGPIQLVARGRRTDLPFLSWDDFLARLATEDELRLARQSVVDSDPAAMIFTSGTTGRSKGALVPHRGLSECGVVQAGRWYGPAPRKLCDLPLNHIGGLGDICTSVLVAGGTVVFRQRFDPAVMLRTVEQERLTHLYCIPSQLLSAVATAEWQTCDLSSLEWILWGGAAAPRRLLEELATKVPRLGTSYSLTESTGSVTYTDPDDPVDVLSWSVGRIDPHYDVVLRRPDGSDAGPGEEGEILIRGAHITLGYFERPDATAEAIDADGFLHTGDLARMEANGHLRLVGRLKEMYKSGGYNVYPREVEEALEQHPGVSHAVVVAVPDNHWGEVGHAFVVTSAVSAEDVLAFARQRLANFKVPKRVWVLEALPTLPIGKIDKAALRRAAIDGTPNS